MSAPDPSNLPVPIRTPTPLPTPQSSKFIDKINGKIASGQPFFSFEYFPPKTADGLTNLYMRFDRMGSLGPLFIDITWGAGGNRPGQHNISLEIAQTAQNICCLDCNMHLTCNTMTKSQLLEILHECKKSGIRNILALRGDPPKYQPETPPEFQYAIDLVKLIREEFGDFFGISVAGYPYQHPDAPSYEAGVQHLKEKVDAGSDFVISQLFFTAADFFKWEKDCRNAGITCPIIPGILPIQGFDSLRNMTKMCAIAVPKEIQDAIAPIKDDDAAIRAYGVEYATKLCKELLAGGVPGLHFYTLNREVATEKILANLGFGSIQSHTADARALPWKKPPTERRVKEDVRPIFWANRHKAYLARTAEWDDFPNGRWGDSRSPAFGELTDYHLFLHQKSLKPADIRKLWGEQLLTPQDAGLAFVRFLNGEIDRLPWVETELGLETGPIKDALIRINQAGFWTINSQPRVNGVDSSETHVGWGGPGGIVYQKAYVEFFTSPELLQVLLRVFNKKGNRFNYQAVNIKNDCFSNTEHTIAVTWGVFPGQEICQPTVVDPAAFFVWKDEAFKLWTAAWGLGYEADSVSRRNIQYIHDNYFLVNVVDNDFTKGDIFELFDIVAEELRNRDLQSFTPIRPDSPNAALVENQNQAL